MKRERALQVVLVLVGLFYCFWGYLLFDDLWHARWLSGHSDVMPMFLSINTALGVCLLVAVKHPAKHRLMIAYGAWSSLAHGFTMTIQSGQAAAHGMHRQDSPWDIVIFVAIGVVLLALLPAKQPSAAGAPIGEPLCRTLEDLVRGRLVASTSDQVHGCQMMTEVQTVSIGAKNKYSGKAGGQPHPSIGATKVKKPFTRVRTTPAMIFAHRFRPKWKQSRRQNHSDGYLHQDR